MSGKFLRLYLSLMNSRKLDLIVHNVRSAENVGSMLRTAEGLSVRVWLTGYTPYPAQLNDRRLPHELKRISSKIHKTALGAEDMVVWRYEKELLGLLKKLRSFGYELVALEQTDQAQDIQNYSPPAKAAIIVGNEVTGLEPEALEYADRQVQLAMLGGKESYNVAVAAAMALYKLRFSL